MGVGFELVAAFVKNAVDVQWGVEFQVDVGELSQPVAMVDIGAEGELGVVVGGGVG